MSDHPPRPTRKGKERDFRESFAADFTDKMVALQRRQHHQSSIQKPRERLAPISTEHPTTTAIPPPAPPVQAPKVPHVTITDVPNADDFSRRLHISSTTSPRSHPARPSQSKALFNPHTDPVPMRRTQEPDAMSESTGSSYARVPAQRQLFDHRRDDPVRFARPKPPVPTPRSSGDQYISSASSYYTPSVASSSFTLSSSTTEGSSDPSSIFDSARPEPKPSNVFTVQLKKLYRDITALEAKIMRDESDDSSEDGRVFIRGAAPSEDAEGMRWQKAIHNHKAFAEMMHQLLGISTAPSVPASLRNIPEKYNVAIRLWSNGFHRLLENLRRSALQSSVALEHLQSFIYFAYTFYTALYEEVNLSSFRSGWLEALGDLARYRMAVAAMLPQPSYSSNYLSASNASSGGSTPHPLMTPTSTMGNASDNSDRPVARIDDSPSPSVGIVAARNFELEPETERWRAMAREWYGAGVADTPGNGKLHHHLGLLSREADGEELRGVYHFTKSMIATHPFATSRESVLPMWSQAAQARRMQADSSFADLFVLLHGMLFTNIQLDDFAGVQARLLERLEIDAPQSREWTMMACINIAAILEYGKPSGLLRKTGALPTAERVPSPAAAAAAKVKLARKERDTDGMDVDGAPSPALSDASVCASDAAAPPAFTRALELSFAMLAHVAMRTGRGRPPSPYASVMLTFLATILKHATALAALERSIPWDALANMLAEAPSRILKREDGISERLAKRVALPEDWCIRGTSWPGRALFEKGFWRSDDALGHGGKEMEVLDARDSTRMDVDEGKLEDDSDAGAQGGESVDVDTLRWGRVAWAGARLARCVDGFGWEGGRAWEVRGTLAMKVARWREEEKREREEEERRKLGKRWKDSEEAMDVDGEDAVESESDSDEDDSAEVRELKARRRYLRSLLQPATNGAPRTSPAAPRRAPRPAGPTLRLLPGYTVLVLDTNILLASLPAVQALIESTRWTVVVPLPVIMELDGLGSGSTPLAEQARAAVELLVTRVRSHSISLKVQTSRGNYLSSLSVRREAVDFDTNEHGSWERSMDDLILRAALWQAEHWVDRSSLLGADGERGREKDTRGASKTVLCSLDRNLRLKARAREVDAAGERELAGLLVGGPAA